MNRFITKSLRSSIAVLKDSLYAEEYAGLPGFLQSIEPRLKAGAFGLFILSVLFASGTVALGILYAACLLLVIGSRISLVFFLKRTLGFIPLFSLFISLPVFFEAGDPLFAFPFFGMHPAVSRQGISQAGLFIFRVTVSVSWVVLLGLTTRHASLLKSLRFFRVPRIFVMVLGMTYRYIFLFLGMMENAYLGMYSRIGRSLPARKGQEAVAWNMAVLWQRSRELNGQVYDAMVSRGFNGEPADLDHARPGFIDFLFLAVAVFAVYYTWITRSLN